MNYIPLPTTLHGGGFQRTQIFRDGNYAIYEKTLTDNPEIGWHEVIIIKTHDGREIGGVTYPAAEVYPSASQWGLLGWTVQPDRTKEDEVHEGP